MDENETPEPRCYGHVFDPAHQGGVHMTGDPKNGRPAHVWTGKATVGCKHCPDPLVKGDQYVCVKNGVMHVRCVAALDASMLDGGPDA